MSLFNTRRFLPLFVAQFLGAFNDNIFKNALVVLVTYRLATAQGGNAQILVTLAAGLFILPFFLFSATAGQLADKYDKATLARYIKMAEIGLMAVGAVGFYTGSIAFLMTTLFLTGVQATFFGPIKYALLPQHLAQDELLSGNAYIESGTFLAILLGTILGGVLILTPIGADVVAVLMIGFSVIGYGASRFIPTAPSANPVLTLRWNIVTETLAILKQSRQNRTVFLSILGISWFWLIGATFLSQFPSFAKDVLASDAHVVTLLLTVFSVGIGIGSILCNTILRGSVSALPVPLAILGITVFTIDLYFASRNFVAPSGELLSIGGFVRQPHAVRILMDLFLLSVCGGIYIVPLYALMQQESDVAFRARVIAANNIMNALFMVAAAITTLLMLKLHFTIPQVFLTTAFGNAIVAVYICRLLPDSLFKSVARVILRFLYRVEVKGLENYAAAGKRTLIIANHTSLLDGLLIAAFLPDKITFAVNSHIAQRWWAKPFLSLVDIFPLDPTNPLAMKSFIDQVKQDKKCMIFPEGRITVTGSLMKIYEGPGLIADKTQADLLPVRIDGAQYSPFSYLKGKLRLQLFPKITLTVLPVHRFAIPDEVTGRERRQRAGLQLYDIMSEMIFESSDYRRTLFASLIGARKTHGGGHKIVEGIERKPLTYSQFLMRCFILGRVLCKNHQVEKTLGVLLPTSVGAVVTFFALQAFGKVPAMLNYSAGAAPILHACRISGLSSVITSKRFVELGKLSPVITELTNANIRVVYVEDLQKQISLFDKIFGVFGRLFPETIYSMTGYKQTGEDTAFLLFTSGSEGLPKGVALSHKNIQANRFQLSSRIDFGPQDIVFNCLPIFHAFGLTGGTLLPILSGIRTFYYPSPLHYRIVSELVYDTNATIMFGTDTFLSGYMRYAHPYDFHSLRYIFAGAEKLKENTRQTYGEKYGVRIFEGYGATETAPVIATNTPMQHKAGSVGRIMPGIAWRLEPVPGIEEGGQLWVKGANVMQGYLLGDRPGIAQPLEDGWYNTGDIVAIDDLGYVTIKGRTKRFAKIGGEMVSLTAVETAVTQLWPDALHAVVAVPDDKKGEQIVLLTTRETAQKDELLPHFRAQKMPEISLPRKIIVVPKLPLLGTGKVDYQAVKVLATI